MLYYTTVVQIVTLLEEIEALLIKNEAALVVMAGKGMEEEEVDRLVVEGFMDK